MRGLTLAQREKIAKADWFVPVPWRQERDSTRENVYCGRAKSGLRFDFLSELSAKSLRLRLFEHKSPLRISAQSLRSGREASCSGRWSRETVLPN